MGKGEAMTLQEKLELAARVMDYRVRRVWNSAEDGEADSFRCMCERMHAWLQRMVAFEWNPHFDDGDSRRLEIACLNWCEQNWNTIPLPTRHDIFQLGKQVFGEWPRAITPEQYRAAVLDLAAEIGKAAGVGEG